MKNYSSLVNLAGNRIVVTIEARMGSTRLPGKVMKPLANGVVLEFMINRVKRATLVDEIVVATSVSPNDDVIAKLCSELGVMCYRGSELDVLERVYCAATTAKADTIVELTGDCPLIDPQIIDQMIVGFLLNKVDYHTNAFYRSYPDGMDVQVVRYAALEQACSEARDDYDREHVTSFLYRNPDLFAISHQVALPNQYWPELGLTLDEESDYDLLVNICDKLIDPEGACLADILELFFSNKISVINSSVVRKISKR